MPENIKNLSKLKFLDVSYNPLIKVPESIGNLKQLRMLILKGSWIKTLPDSIAGLENLQLLVLGAGEIGTPAGCLKTLPESIGALKRLRWLLLSYNSLEKIPESIGDLQDLIELDTRANELTSLPASIGNVKSLKILDISSNKLKGLPKELDNLKCLEILNVDNNNIQDIGFKNGLLYLFKDLRSQLSEKIMQTSTQDVEELRPFLNQEKTTFTLTALRVLCRCMPLNMFSQASFIDKKSKFDKQIFKEEKMREFFALLLKEKLSFTETMQLHVQYGSFNINELLAYLKEIDVLSNNVRSTHKCSTSY